MCKAVLPVFSENLAVRLRVLAVCHKFLALNFSVFESVKIFWERNIVRNILLCSCYFSDRAFGHINCDNNWSTHLSLE